MKRSKSQKRPKRVRYLLKFAKGGLVPADGFTAKMLNAKYRVGDIALADLTKPRTPWYHRKAHLFGQLVAENIEAFEHLGAHEVLKRLQIEGNIACDEMAINFPGIGPCTYRVPRSLDYASMDQTEFEETYSAMCRYVSKTYWPTLSEDQIAELAELGE